MAPPKLQVSSFAALPFKIPGFTSGLI